MKKRNYIVIAMPRRKNVVGAKMQRISDGCLVERRRWLVPNGFEREESFLRGSDFFLTYTDALQAAMRKTEDWPAYKFKVYCVTRVK